MNFQLSLNSLGKKKFNKFGQKAKILGKNEKKGRFMSERGTKKYECFLTKCYYGW